MKGYGARGRRNRYWLAPRGNRGRNQTSATSPKNRHGKSARSWRSRSNDLAERKSARQVAHREIASELCLWDLEQELDGLAARRACLSTRTRHLRVVGAEDVLQEPKSEHWSIWVDYGEHDYDERGDYWYKGCEDECECSQCLIQESYDEDPHDPMHPSWVNLWVDGVVHDDEGRDVLWYDEYDAWCDACDHEYDDFAYWDQISNSNYLGHVDPKLRADEDRNAERLRAGERYFNQNKRTVSK